MFIFVIFYVVTIIIDYIDTFNRQKTAESHTEGGSDMQRNLYPKSRRDENMEENVKLRPYSGEFDRPGYRQEGATPADRAEGLPSWHREGSDPGASPPREGPATEPAHKIVITNKSEYVPRGLDRPLDFPGKQPNPRNNYRRYLIIGKRALKKLKDSLDWGQKTKRNVVEQGGVLLGEVAYHGNEIYNLVRDVIFADTSGSSVFVEFTRAMWSEMQDGLARLNETLDERKRLVIVGWFHTHPNDLPVFMSGTDINTQRLNFSLDWQASLVMNPHSNKFRAFFGGRATEGKVVLPGPYGHRGSHKGQNGAARKNSFEPTPVG
jgi:proteasome lid subunit RPN8/RPN11